MGKFLNSCPWVGNLTLFQALAGGSCYHLNSTIQLTGEFNHKDQIPRGFAGGAWAVLELTGT